MRYKYSTFRRYVVFVSLLCLLGIAGCAVPRPQAKGPLPTPDPATAATLHVYRASDAPRRPDLTFYLYVDGNRIGKLGSTQTHKIALPPGRYSLVVQGEILGFPEAVEPVVLQVDLETQKEYFVRFSTRNSIGAIVGTTVVTTVDRYFGQVPKQAWQQFR